MPHPMLINQAIINYDLINRQREGAITLLKPKGESADTLDMFLNQG